jgi:hypothetical protein
MKVKSLLAKAAKCKTQGDADELLELLERVFGESRPLGCLSQNNREAYMEGDTPFVRFELNHLISEHYITMIRPEIRDGALVVTVATNHMLDGLGMASQSWDVEADLECVFEAEDDRTIGHLAQQAKEQALANHAQLIERVGVSRIVALKAAASSWKALSS